MVQETTYGPALDRVPCDLGDTAGLGLYRAIPDNIQRLQTRIQSRRKGIKGVLLSNTQPRLWINRRKVLTPQSERARDLGFTGHAKIRGFDFTRTTAPESNVDARCTRTIFHGILWRSRRHCVCSTSASTKKTPLWLFLPDEKRYK